MHDIQSLAVHNKAGLAMRNGTGSIPTMQPWPCMQHNAALCIHKAIVVVPKSVVHLPTSNSESPLLAKARNF